MVPDTGMTQDDEGLMLRLRDQADNTAYEELYSRHWSKSRNYFAYRIRGQDGAVDLAQEAWVKIWTSRATYKDGQNFLLWHFIICKSVLLDYFRRIRTRPEIDPDGLDPLLDRLAGDTITHVLEVFDRAFCRLSDKERLILHLNFFESLMKKEIAKALGITEPTLRVRLAKAVLKLARYLRESGLEMNTSKYEKKDSGELPEQRLGDSEKEVDKNGE